MAMDMTGGSRFMVYRIEKMLSLFFINAADFVVTKLEFRRINISIEFYIVTIQLSPSVFFFT